MLKIEDVVTRVPAAGEVTMKVAAVGLSRGDDMYFHGHYFEQPTLPSGLGSEAVGIVTLVGPGVDSSLVGRRFSTMPGSSMNAFPVLSDEAVVAMDSLMETPMSVADADAAGIWLPYGTAYGALVVLGKVGPGDFVIITAASSSVGLAAIQITHARGAVAIATTRTSAKKQRLLDFGADHVIATEEEDLVARVLEITGGTGARIVFDSVGGSYVTTLADATAAEGTIYLYGSFSGEPTLYPMNAFSRGVALAGYTIGQMKTPDRLASMKQFIIEHLVDGTLVPKIDRTFKFSDIVSAYRYLESNAQVGKIVVTL